MSVGNIVHYPSDRATGFVLLTDGTGKYYGFCAKTLKEKLEIMAHYSGHGLEFAL